MIETGDLLAQKYRVERLLGKGGMGYVFAAVHEQLGQRVAVKFMAPQLARNPDAVARFLREARSCVRIQGEHVARVLDVETHADGTPYMVMEFLSGFDLAAVLEKRGQLPLEDAVDYVLQACEALAEAHAQGIVHRDLKPSNLFLTHRPDGSPLIKVLDFGISKAVADSEQVTDEVTQSLTHSQHVLGSPHYMSPEQARSPKTLDTRSDIWALGIILYELLGGRRPFEGDTPMAILAAVITEPVPDLHLLAPHLPREMAAVIGKCLQKSPERRFSGVAELAHAMEPLARPESRSIVTRIESILRTRAKMRAERAEAQAELLGDTVPATLESARESDSQYGLGSHTESAPLSSATWKPPAPRPLWPLGVLALLAFGALMYAVGTTRRSDQSQSAAAPAQPLDSAAPLPAAQPNALGDPSIPTPATDASSLSAARPVPTTVPERGVVAHGPARTKSPAPAAPSASSVLETPPGRGPSDPFDQRR